MRGGFAWSFYLARSWPGWRGVNQSGSETAGFPCLGELWSISPVLADRKALCPGQAKPGAAPASLEKASLENASPVARTPPRQARPDQAHRHC